MTILIDNPDGEKTGVVIEGTFSGSLWEPKFNGSQIYNTFIESERNILTNQPSIPAYVRKRDFNQFRFDTF